MSIDPLTKQFPWYTPYQFAGNTPIQAIDLDGAEEYHYLAKWDKETGRILFSIENDKTVKRRSFLWWEWTPKLKYTVVFQNSKGEASEYVFTSNGKIVQLEGPTSTPTVLNKISSFKKFLFDSRKIKYQNEEKAEADFGSKFISEDAENLFTLGNALIVYNNYNTQDTKTKVPVEEGSEEIIHVVVVNGKKHPESAKHIDKAQESGHPEVLTVDRGGATSNRRQSLKGTKTKKGYDRDEYPPAMFKEGGKGASVKLIPSSDNRGSGASIARQLQGVPDGTKVRIKTNY